MTTSSGNTIRYYMFSMRQNASLKAIAEKMGQEYRPKKVIVNGKYKPYTEIVSDPKLSRESDAIIVTKEYV